MEKNSKIYEYGCLLVHLNIPSWESFCDDLKIEEEDLFEINNERYGRESEPHCTILYGIHDDVDEKRIINIFQGLRKSDFKIKVGEIDCFFNEYYDVLKLNVSCNKLNELNHLAKLLPHTSQFNDYNPHITIAYLLKGRGNKYINRNYLGDIDSNSIFKIVYSKTNGDKIDISIN